MRRLSLVAFALAALLTPAGALAQRGLTPAEAESTNAQRIDDFYWLILILSAVVFLAVFVPLGFFLVRYRSRGRGREVEGPQIRGNTNLELAWTIVPVLLLATIATFVFVKLPGIRAAEASDGEEVLTIRVEGRQFYWNYVYPNGVIGVDRLTIPVDTPVKLQITAPKGDVIHSFWVPALQGKFDAIPGHTNETVIRATGTGVFQGACTELCGLEHASMRITAEVMPKEEFARWYESGQREDELGQITYEGACAKCHGYDAEGDIGPRLAGNPIVAQRDTVEQVVRDGRSAMPSVGDGWSDEQMNALLDYLEETYAPKGENTREGIGGEG